MPDQKTEVGVYTRMIRGGILTSDRVDRIAGDPGREVFYRRLLNVVDDFGLFSADPRRLRTALYPLRPDSITEAEIEQHLTACEAAGLLRRYEARGKRYLAVWNFGQRIQRTTLRYPPPPELIETLSNFHPPEEEDEPEEEQEHENERTLSCASDDAREDVTSTSHKQTDSATTLRLAEQQIAWFEIWWPGYWRKESRADALKAFRKHVKTEAMFAIVREAVRRQSPEMCGREKRHRPLAGSWLNSERWNDPVEPIRAKLRRSRALKLSLPHRSAKAFSPEEKAALLSEAKKRRSPSIYPALMLALHAGMRDAEIRGLQWNQVDLQRAIVTVGAAKTQAAEGRTIPLNADVLAALLAHAKWFLKKFGTTHPELYVFPFGQPQPTDPTRPVTTFKTGWAECKRKAGVKGRWHDSRHTFITDLAESGEASDETIRDIAGHVSKSMLKHYSHIRMQAKRRAVDALVVTPVSDGAAKETAKVGLLQ